MNKFYFFSTMLLLGISSCGKSDFDNDFGNKAGQSVQYIIIGDYKYPKDSLSLEMSKSLGLDTSEFYFDQTSEMYLLKGYDMQINPSHRLKLK